MTSLNLTEAVERAAAATYRAACNREAGSDVAVPPPFEALPPIQRHAWLESILPAVDAAAALIAAQALEAEVAKHRPDYVNGDGELALLDALEDRALEYREAAQ